MNSKIVKNKNLIEWALYMYVCYGTNIAQIKVSIPTAPTSATNAPTVPCSSHLNAFQTED